MKKVHTFQGQEAVERFKVLLCITESEMTDEMRAELAELERVFIGLWNDRKKSRVRTDRFGKPISAYDLSQLPGLRSKIGFM